MTENASNNEFEREPVADTSLLGFKSFIGMYAGEHCAGTELMIGPLFVAAGVSAFDVVVGLLIGNLMAVLSWMFLTAPIATRVRLTLYYQLEKICGRSLVTLYNLANGVMFCFLAGSMITVSATAVGVWINFPMPGLNDVYPNSVGWVLAVLVVGMLIAIVAAYGYASVARFANVAAPWMVLVFLAFGLIALRQFIDLTGQRIDSPAALWDLATTRIWPGGDPLPGQMKFTLWHVIFFAWFCNMAMHIGMSDLTIFRFARHSWYGVATAAGMYVGHFMAWLSAAMLFAYQLQTTHPDEYLTDLLVEHSAEYGASDRADLLASPLTPRLIRQGMEIEQQLVSSGQLAGDACRVQPPTPLPGPLAYGACGVAGLICVVIAGWTTANPTIYRAGLAFQAIVPRISRFRVTLLTGLIAAIAGVFPAIAMRLLGFVALYGLILMPMGAIIFVDYYLMKRWGLQRYYADHQGIHLNWAAAVTWAATLVICLALVNFAGIPIYFVGLPGWFVAAAIYLAASFVYQRRSPYRADGPT